jgi:hypothetical protein
MNHVTFTLSEKQIQTLAGMISLGVSALGAQIAQGGAAALKSGAQVLSDAADLQDVIEAAINEAAKPAEPEQDNTPPA